ncbi:HTH-type transcriptional regulator UlaR [Dickeya zeae]|uniref:HTH-type transcriptional regulator UlaR n=1 Tax=Dickeya zeae TaxID=204042 RepID=UPI000C99A2E4|nr:HTH-type transcriptional regulator UlaR [Dickeya zeae]AUQ27028.1 HTH-type transcriptional regulator UlaR [Dickeya zeae]UJR60080.1 HTH-type transcriptional regulator UlaR [Dickeya zeae]
MTEAQRHSAILELLNQKRHLSVTGIMQAFDISPATARRDINKLNDSGKLRKVRNGAEALTQTKTHWSPLNSHEPIGRGEFSHHSEKMRIAQAAAALIKPGESAVINCGSTAFVLGQEICGQDVQVITNYFPLANYLIEHDHDGVVIIGGQYNKSQSITLAPQDEISSLYAGHWMFTSGKGITADGLYKMDMLTAMAEQKMLNHIGKLVVLADSSKVGQRAGMLFCGSDRIDILITGKDADQQVIAQLQDKGVSVMLV